MFKIMSAAALWLAAFLFFVPQASAQSCVTMAMLRTTLSTNIAGVNMRTIEKETAQSFVAAFNAVPPRSDLAADAVLLARHENAPQAVAIFFWKTCMTGRAVLPTETLDRILASIETEA
jgi:hypothetical protein